MKYIVLLMNENVVVNKVEFALSSAPADTQGITTQPYPGHMQRHQRKVLEHSPVPH